MKDFLRSLPLPLETDVSRGLHDAEARGLGPRLWARDATLWSGRDEARWLGWLELPERETAELPALERAAGDAAGFAHVVVLGMGGSSLCPDVLARTFGRQAGHPELLVLDSTDPAQVRACEALLDPARTLVIVASKSGSTLEPEILRARFFARFGEALGPAEAGRRFVAITDPGSKLEQAARADGYRAIWPGIPEVGGRFSALSHFGMLPAALAGLDVARLLAGGRAMAQACGPDVPSAGNPGLVLGLVLGVAARHGVDKLTLVASPGLAALGAWLEQLVAESTGKDGKVILPIDGEALAGPEAYGDDRIFVYLRLASAPDPAQDAGVAVLEQAGRPVLRISVKHAYDLGGELFRWEMATAVMGAVLGVNPFDQPDVEAAKVAARAVSAEYERTGSLPPETALAAFGPFEIRADPRNAGALRQGVGEERSLEAYLRVHFCRLRPCDYAAILAFLPMEAGTEAVLQRARHRVRDRFRVATSLGFGPRFLHSTGQAHKGGPGSGVFLQLTCEDAEDLEVPGQRASFGVVKAAQARGDFQVLADRNRRVLRVHLKGELHAALAGFDAALAAALA